MEANIANLKQLLIDKSKEGNIYYENIRSWFDITTLEALNLSQQAVYENILSEHFGVVCSNETCERIIASYNNISEIPKIIECSTCEIEGKDFTFNTDDLDIISFYKIKSSKICLTQDMVDFRNKDHYYVISTIIGKSNAEKLAKEYDSVVKNRFIKEDFHNKSYREIAYLINPEDEFSELIDIICFLQPDKYEKSNLK